MDLPPVNVVVVNWNGRHLLEECLRSLARLDYSGRVETILVDNGSRDHSVTFVRSRFPRVRVLENEVNNYARANNLGIAAGDAPYVALLNNDTRVDREWLLELVRCLEDETRAVGAGSKIVFADGRINSTGIEEIGQRHWRDRGFGEVDRGQYGIRERVDGLSNCAILLRRSALEEVSFLDEDFEMYYEDVDLSYRLRRRGHLLFYEPRSVVCHRYNATIRSVDGGLKKDWYGERNRLFVIARHFPWEIAERALTSLYLLRSRVAEFKQFLPCLLEKWAEAGPGEVECGLLSRILLVGKLELLRRERRISALMRSERRLEAEKVMIRAVYDRLLRRAERDRDKARDDLARDGEHSEHMEGESAQ